MTNPPLRDGIAAAMRVAEFAKRRATADADYSQLGDDAVTILSLLAELHTAPADNTGMPCPYCAQTLPRLSLQRVGDTDTFDFTVSAHGQTAKGIKGLCKMLEQLTRGR